MAFKTVTDLSAEVTISLGGANKKTGKKNPTSVEGFYLGKKMIEDRKKKSGVSYIYFFQTSKGNVGVWGKTDMDRKLLGVKEGEMTRITHTGMMETTNGPMYKYSVEVDSDNTIEVTTNESGSNQTANEDDEESASYGKADEDDEETESCGSFQKEERMQQVALGAAERKAKVEALLKRNK